MDFGDWLLGAKRTKKAPFMINYAGYILRFLPIHPRAQQNGYVLEHIYQWERYNKACLLKWAIIRHKDGNRKNNDGRNLKARCRVVLPRSLRHK